MAKESAAVTKKPAAKKSTKQSKPSAASLPLAAASLMPLSTLGYEDPKHIARTLSNRGGPWESMVVATHIADEAISKMLASGYDLLFADSVQMTPEGIYFFWMLAKPVGHAGQGFKEIRHITRPVTPGAVAESPAMTAFGANAFLASLMNEGWRLFRPKPLAVDPGGGLSLMWIIVR